MINIEKALTGKEIFCSIGDQLSNDKPLLLAQKQYLISVAASIKQGMPENAAIENTKLVPMPRGKKSEAYKKAIRKRDLQLTEAVSFLTGANWARCTELGLIIKQIMHARRSDDELTPANEIERILIALIDSGLKLPSTTNSLYQIIYAHNS